MRQQYKMALAAGKSRPEALRLALAGIRGFRYGKDDYVWAFNNQSILIAHPDPNIDGTDFSKVVDVNARLVIPIMVQIGHKHGEGFHSYWWNRLNHTKASEKLAYT